MPTIAEVAKEAVVGAWALPGDISIVGYDGIEPARHAGLTTVAEPLEESGARDAARLLGALEGIRLPGGGSRSSWSSVWRPVHGVDSGSGEPAHDRSGARSAPGSQHAGTANEYVPDLNIRTEGELVSKRLLYLLCTALACGVLVAACGGDDSSSGGGASSEASGTTEGVKQVDPASMKNASGSATYCTGKDTSGDLKEGVAEFNKANPGSTIKLTEFPEDAQQQHDQFTQRQRAKSSDCDGFEEDVVWTAEFASQKWLMDMTPYIESRKAEFVPSTLETVTFDKKIFGAPRVSDSGMMYYRTDEVKQFPATWQELYSEAQKGEGIVYQGSSYEGLTVDYLELAFAAGGDVLSEDGSKSVINSPENLKALEFMVDGIKSGAAPKSVTTMQEEQARRTWESGKASFMRNWSYCYALSQKAPKVKGKFAVAPYPSFEGGGKASVLGGHNMVISVYSQNPGLMLKFIDYMTSEKRITKNAVKYSKTPTIAASYDDPAVKKAMPFSEALRAGVEQAKSRPVSPVYPQISEAIFKNVNAALSGSTSAQDALKTADSDINKALQTF